MATYSPEEIAVLQKYRILDQDGGFIEYDLIQSRLGPGPMLSPEVIAKFLAADKSPDRRYLDWIFFQAAGGLQGKELAVTSLAVIQKCFIAERVAGYVDPDTGESFPATDEEDAVAQWEKVEAICADAMVVSDQDGAEKLGVFGFYRNWPGGKANRNYEPVVVEVMRWQGLLPHVNQMNAELGRTGGGKDKQISPILTDKITAADLKKLNDQIERYFAAKVARQDIRLSKHKREDDLVYDDDYLRVLVPLTYGTAVKFGHDAWKFANRDTFERILTGDGANYKDPWYSLVTDGKVMVYVMFKYPMPVKVVRAGSEFNRSSLTNLALELDTNELAALPDPDFWQAYDEENGGTKSIADIKQMILNEPTRVDQTDKEWPIKRGPNAYTTPEEAQEVIRHLDAALAAVIEWAKTFKVNKLKPNALKSK